MVATGMNTHLVAPAFVLVMVVYLIYFGNRPPTA